MIKILDLQGKAARGLRRQVLKFALRRRLSKLLAVGVSPPGLAF